MKTLLILFEKIFFTLIKITFYESKLSSESASKFHSICLFLYILYILSFHGEYCLFFFIDQIIDHNGINILPRNVL